MMRAVRMRMTMRMKLVQTMEKEALLDLMCQRGLFVDVRGRFVLTIRMKNK